MASLTGCADAVPRELADARVAYQQAQNSKASTLAPADLQTAKESLDHAEHAFRDDGADQRTRDLAYIAQRKAQLAMVQGDLVSAQRDKEQAQNGLLDTATMTAEQRNRQLQQSNQQLQQTNMALDQERQRRADAEKALRDAMARLQAFAAIKQDTRGTIITMPGGVLFETGKSALLSTAQEKLNQVADALLKDRTSTMTVEGYTDSQGDAAMNQKLSEARANSVRDYLVSRGIAADRIKAVGYGKDKPVASNATPEGRADNRRVEIVVANQGGETTKAAGLWSKRDLPHPLPWPPQGGGLTRGRRCKTRPGRRGPALAGFGLVGRGPHPPPAPSPCAAGRGGGEVDGARLQAVPLAPVTSPQTPSLRRPREGMGEVRAQGTADADPAGAAEADPDAEPAGFASPPRHSILTDRSQARVPSL